MYTLCHRLIENGIFPSFQLITHFVAITIVLCSAFLHRNIHFIFTLTLALLNHLYITVLSALFRLRILYMNTIPRVEEKQKRSEKRMRHVLRMVLYQKRRAINSKTVFFSVNYGHSPWQMENMIRTCSYI